MDTSAVTLLGGGDLGRALAGRLPGARFVAEMSPSGQLEPGPAWTADFASIRETEIACAGSRTLVMLAGVGGSSLYRALLADSVARAAKRCGVEHLVFYAPKGKSRSERILLDSGATISVLRGGGEDPTAQLDALVRRGPGPDVTSASPSAARHPRVRASVQVLAAPRAMSAADIASRYFDWLAQSVPGVRTEVQGERRDIRFAGGAMLTLCATRGEAEADSQPFDVVGGALASNRDGRSGRFEFRRLLDGSTVVSALTGFAPAMPRWLYGITQSALHDRVMRRFSAWLGDGAASPVSPSVGSE